MSKNKKRLIAVTIAVIVILILEIIVNLNKKDNSNKQNNPENKINIVDNEFGEVDKNQIEYQENTTINEIKNNIGATGDTNIYEVQQEYDGRNVVTIKANVKYKVAFAGMIKNTKPELTETDEILNKNHPKENGIWIEEKSRKKVLDLLEDEKINSKYTINQEGYLKIKEKNNQTELDKKIERAININKQNILCVSSVCYIVDNITGEILDYNFEKMDKYQTYEYFEDENKKIIFINENKENQLTKIDILNNIVEML